MKNLVHWSNGIRSWRGEGEGWYGGGMITSDDWRQREGCEEVAGRTWSQWHWDRHDSIVNFAMSDLFEGSCVVRTDGDWLSPCLFPADCVI